MNPNPAAHESRRFLPIGFIITGLLIGLGVGGACSTCITGAALSAGGEEQVPGSKDRVGVVELTGVISDATEVVRQIREEARREELKAIVLRIDSPGGAVAPSQEIFEALRRASRMKPVVASMGNVAASGGFWSAMGADYVFASPGSLTGSIGVITQLPDFRGLADLAHFSVRTFKSGPLKDAGNPLREMTPADVSLFTSLIDDIYQQFVKTVAERRKLDIEVVKKIADGRVMTGRAAQEAGLIDELGGLEDAARRAVLLAAQRAAPGLAAQRAAPGAGQPKDQGHPSLENVDVPTLIYPKKPLGGILRLLAEGAASSAVQELVVALDHVWEEIHARARVQVEARG